MGVVGVQRKCRSLQTGQRLFGCGNRGGVLHCRFLSQAVDREPLHLGPFPVLQGLSGGAEVPRAARAYAHPVGPAVGDRPLCQRDVRSAPHQVSAKYRLDRRPGRVFLPRRIGRPDLSFRDEVCRKVSDHAFHGPDLLGSHRGKDIHVYRPQILSEKGLQSTKNGHRGDRKACPRPYP